MDKKTETKATTNEILAREKLFELFDDVYREKKISKVDLFQNLGVFIRCSGLTKLLFINEIYEKILNVPGIVMEFGVHLGQNLVTFENLRALYEPWNQNRRIVGFDTFTQSGYASSTEIDGYSSEIRGDSYQLPESYLQTLSDVLRYHERDHILSHIPKVSFIVGDVNETVPNFFDSNKGDVVSLAYFDLATYTSTKTCLEAVAPHLIPGSVLLMDELNFKLYPGASIAFKEFVAEQKIDYRIETSKYMKDRSIVTFLGFK